MSDLVFNSRTADKFVVRLPDGLRDEVDAVAVEQSTSMNSIFIRAARQFIAGQRRQELLLDALEAQLSSVDAVHVNQISKAAGNVNQTTQIPGSLITENPAVTESMHIDDRVTLARDAARYRHLRDRECIEDASVDLLVMVGDTYFTGAELDKQIDDAIRLTALLEKHGEPA